MAADALATAMDFYFEDKRPVPPPSDPKRGETLVELSTSVAAKVPSEEYPRNHNPLKSMVYTTRAV
jgi:hypothetical protein